jgi:hypothetical protein
MRIAEIGISTRQELIPKTADACLRAGFFRVRFDNGRKTETLSTLYALQELAERHLEGSRKSRQMAKSYLPRTPLEIGDVDLVNTRLFGKVDLPPAPLLSELSDSLANLDANIGVHSSSIDLVEALYLVDALSRKIRVEDGSGVPVSRIAPECRGNTATRRRWLRRQPKLKILRILQPGKGITATRYGLLEEAGNDDLL